MNLPDWSAVKLAQVVGIIQDAADSAGVPQDLALAIASQESRFTTTATGAAGEIGMFQLMPATARALGYTGSDLDLYDPATNARLGCLYLAQQLTRYGGDQAQAISAYNAGHAISGNVAYVTGVQARQAYFDSLDSGTDVGIGGDPSSPDATGDDGTAPNGSAQLSALSFVAGAGLLWLAWELLS